MTTLEAVEVDCFQRNLRVTQAVTLNEPNGRLGQSWLTASR
jgi:hypothetical protein